VISYTIRNRKAIGGINMTASHNPAEYQGLKFSTSNGAPATQDVTRQIEANIAQLQAKGWSMQAAAVGTFECKTSTRSQPTSNKSASWSILRPFAKRD